MQANEREPATKAEYLAVPVPMAKKRPKVSPVVVACAVVAALSVALALVAGFAHGNGQGGGALEEDAGAMAAAGGEEPGASGAAGPLEMQNGGFGALGKVKGETAWSFTGRNATDKTITYLEITCFCYDASGRPVNGADGTNIERRADSSLSLAPGEAHTPQANGYWAFKNCPGGQVAAAVPFASYAVFDDGSTWGTPAAGADEEARAKQEAYLAFVAGLKMAVQTPAG